jgi:hypothetical protein
MLFYQSAQGRSATLSLFETLKLGMIYDGQKERLRIDNFWHDFYHSYKTMSISVKNLSGKRMGELNKDSTTLD